MVLDDDVDKKFIIFFPITAARERFSAAMAILHLIVRPFSTILMIKNLEERSGATGIFDRK